MKERGLELLKQAIGLQTADFRNDQWEAVEALLRRERLLVVERTG
jgi:ATP-dependent DNA helicase RecQ